MTKDILVDYSNLPYSISDIPPQFVSYSIRYRVDGGAWSTPVLVAISDLPYRLSSFNDGESIDVGVTSICATTTSDETIKNITIGSDVTCPVTNFTISDVSYKTFKVTLTGYDSTKGTYDISLDGGISFAIIGFNSESRYVSGLTEFTTYDVVVRTNCNSGGSSMTGVQNVTTKDGILTVTSGQNPVTVGTTGGSGTITGQPGSIINVRVSVSGTDPSAHMTYALTATGWGSSIGANMTNNTHTDFTVTIPMDGIVNWTLNLFTTVSSQSGKIELL